MLDRDIAQAFSLRLKNALQQRHLKATDLARLTGVSDAKVSGWMHGKGLTITNLSQLANALHISLNWLVLGIGTEQLATNGRINSLEKELVIALRHYGPETVGYLNRFLSRFYIASLGSSLKQFHAYNINNALDLPILILSVSGKLLSSNSALKQLFSISEEKIHTNANKSYTQWLPRFLHETIRRLLVETIKTGQHTSQKIFINETASHNNCYLLKARMIDTPDTQNVSSIQIIFFPLGKT